jgi:hypothetical protein
MPFTPDLDASQPALDASQRRQVEQLVRRAGKTCEVCGSEDLSCDDRAVRTMSEGISVRLFCNNRKDPVRRVQDRTGGPHRPAHEPEQV